jgi:hypothetical protein
MDIDWLRDIDWQCKEVGVSHFFKQAYVGGQICEEPLLDGKLVQEVPTVLTRLPAALLPAPLFA